LHTDNLFRDESLPLGTSEQFDGHPNGVQKRGRRKSMTSLFFKK